MNIKIMELAAQAEEYMEIPMPDDVYHMGDDIFRRHKIFNREKFAELIVRECSRVIVDGGYWSSGLIGPKRQCTPPEIAQMIKQHFGVEE